EQGRLAEADSQLQTYLHLGQQPDRARARHAKARLLFMQGRFRECHDEITSFLRDTAQEYNKAIAKANELAKSDKQAASALVRSAKATLASSDKKQKTLGLLLAATFRQLGQIDDAEKQAAHVQDLPDAEWPDPILQQVNALRTGKKHQLNLADIAFGRGEYDKSIALLEDTIRNYPDEIYAYVFLGRALNRKGTQAKNAADSALALKYFTRSKSVLEEGLARSPDSVEAIFRLAFATYNLGSLDPRLRDISKEEELYRRAVQLKPDFARAWFNLSDCLHRQGRLGDAVTAMEQAENLEPNALDTKLALANLYLENQQLDKATAQLNAVLKTDPQNKHAKQLLQRIPSQN
ncbi:MAG: tetratricopeptide repeat protein, partial [Planctomycetales bacterium]|nr:tetratricopeptide repeat protein [Planctomycetales bacterium]